MANRKNISLPGDQAALVQQVRQAVGPSVPVIAVMIHGALLENSSLPPAIPSPARFELDKCCCAIATGGSMDISEVLSDADAVLDAYYPGQFGATAIAGEPQMEIVFHYFILHSFGQLFTNCHPNDTYRRLLICTEALFGAINPSGKLPYTYYKASYTDQVSMDDFGCAKPPGRGYRYLPTASKHILLPAFHGMSYTSFKLHAATAPHVLHNQPSTNSLVLEVQVENTGSRSGSETVLAFFRPENRTNPGGAKLLPLQRRLCGLAQTGPLAAKGTKTLQINVTIDSLAMADEIGALVSVPGKYTIILSTGTQGAEEISIPLAILGERFVLEQLPPGI